MHKPGLKTQNGGASLAAQRQSARQGRRHGFDAWSGKIPHTAGQLSLCCTQSLSRVRLFATPWTVAHQAPLSTGFSRQEYWSGLPCPPPRDLPHPGTEVSHTAGGFFSIWTTREAQLSLWATTTEPALWSPGAATTEIHVPRSLSSPRVTSAIRSRHTCN